MEHHPEKEMESEVIKGLARDLLLFGRKRVAPTPLLLRTL